jgi:hypothetical protein
MKPIRRWSLYALAALLTAAAMAWVDRTVDDLLPAVSARATTLPSGGATGVSRSSTDPAWTMPRREFKPAAADPFELADVDAGVAAPMRAPVSAVAAAASATAPPLPFAYVGQWVEKGITVAFLTTPQGLNVAARKGATLDGNYRVENIDGQGIEFKYLPLNLNQKLSFAESRSAAAEPGAAPAAPESSEETN